MAREPGKVSSAYLRANRVEIARRLHLDSRILLLDRERQRKCTVDKRNESCTKSRDDLASVQIFPAFKQVLPQPGAQLRDPGCEVFVFLEHPDRATFMLAGCAESRYPKCSARVRSAHSLLFIKIANLIFTLWLSAVLIWLEFFWRW